MKPKPKSTRRDFLVGKSALDAVAHLPERLLPAEDDASPAAASGSRDRATYLVQIARDAMGCQFQVLLNAGQHSGASEVALDALDRVEELEDQLSVYRATSEVSCLNREAAARVVEVENGLYELFEISLRLFEETGGAFDITSGPLSKLWGFHRREGRLPAAEEIRESLRSVGSQWLALTRGSQSVRFANAGLEVNFNAIGKGYALDQAASVLRGQGVEDFLIHGGQSSVVAGGSRQGRESAPGWRVALRHPLRHELRLGEVTLRDRALGTSGSGNQYFHFGGRRYGHVLDPRSGYPAEGVLSATVLAPDATRADALATAFFVMGVDAAESYCERYPELGAILVAAGDQAGSLILHTWGLAEEEWSPEASD